MILVSEAGYTQAAAQTWAAGGHAPRRYPIQVASWRQIKGFLAVASIEFRHGKKLRYRLIEVVRIRHSHINSTIRTSPSTSATAATRFRVYRASVHHTNCIHVTAGHTSPTAIAFIGDFNFKSIKPRIYRSNSLYRYMAIIAHETTAVATEADRKKRAVIWNEECIVVCAIAACMWHKTIGNGALNMTNRLFLCDDPA